MLTTTRTALEQKSLTNLGNQSWNFDKVPDRDAAGIHFIDKVEFLIILSAITQGGGGAASPLNLANIVQAVTLKANDGQAWGMDSVLGQTIQESRYFGKGKPLPFSSDINGDSNVAAGAGPVSRLIRVVFDFDAFGRPGTYTPPALFFKASGTLAAMLTAPANNTVLTGTIQVIVHTHAEPKLRAIQRLTLRSNKIASLDFTWPGSGMCVQAFFEKPSAIAAADITALTMKGSGGFEMLDSVDILSLRGEEYIHNPEVTAAYQQRHFCDPVGGTYPRAALVFPPHPTSEGVMSLPTSDKFTSKVVGDATQFSGNGYSACSVMVEPLSPSFGDKQLVAQGAARGSISQTQHDTPGGTVHNDRLKAYIPKVVGTPSAVK